MSCLFLPASEASKQKKKSLTEDDVWPVCATLKCHPNSFLRHLMVTMYLIMLMTLTKQSQSISNNLEN